MNRKHWIAALLVVVIVGSAIVVAFLGSKKDQSATNEYQDPTSGQTVSDPPGKTPENFGTPQDQPLYLGFDVFLNKGMTLKQLNNLKQAFYQYSKSRSVPLDEVSVNISSVVTKKEQTSSDTFFFLEFEVKFDRKNSYKARVDYSGLSTVRLYLNETNNGAIIYDSQVIGAED